MKSKFLGLALLSIFASQVVAGELEAFKKGFDVGLEAVEYQLQHEGYQPKVIQLDKPYVVVIEIKDSPTNDILYFQHLLNKDGIKSTLTKEYLILDSFDRLPDAKELSQLVNGRYAVVSKIKEFTDGQIETYPILFNRTFEPIVEHVAKEVNKTVVTKYETPLDIRWENQTYKKVAKYKHFSIKNSAISYKYKYSQDKNITCGDSTSKCFDSSLFYENKIFNVGTKFKKGGVYRTTDGEYFQKVYNTNLFFSLEDIK
jgi:hypothetical protein